MVEYEGRTDSQGNREFIIQRSGGPKKVFNIKRRRNPFFQLPSNKKIKKLDSWYEDLIYQLRSARISSQITQAQLGKLVKSNQAAISRFELGKMNATINFISRLAKALDVDIKIITKKT